VVLLELLSKAGRLVKVPGFSSRQMRPYPAGFILVCHEQFGDLLIITGVV